ncbi:hypothetical protein DFP74_5390 [Nocardiopsis sp. Huas11]|nr:hypothetical protein [Nocardiopsis sp. Huas11]RKS09648.1 hypothetical protein DFP74_5390 [Nocardiopsis sp. Huas11]
MSVTERMLDTHPGTMPGIGRARLRACARECQICEQACRDLSATL